MSPPRDPSAYRRPHTRVRDGAKAGAGEADRFGARAIVHAPKDIWNPELKVKAACGKRGIVSEDQACEDVTCKRCLKMLGVDP